MDWTCLSSTLHRCSFGLRAWEFRSHVIHQTKLPSFIAPWSSSNVPIIGAFGIEHGSAWAPWLVCGYAASYTTNCYALCVLMPHRSDLTEASSAIRAPTHQLWGQNVHNISHPLTGTTTKKYVSFTSPVASRNVMPDWCTSFLMCTKKMYTFTVHE